MVKNKYLNEVFTILLICSIGIVSIVFITLFVETILTGDQQVNKTFLVSLGTVVVSLITTLTLSFFRKNIKIVYKILFVSLIVIAFASIVLYCFAKFGLLDKFDSVEEFRQYVDSFGTWTEVLFVIIQFLQVVVLPVPSFITVGAGVLLYGPLKGALLSVLGIILGSYLAFFIGRYLGVKVVRWVIGEDNLDKTLKLVKGKDKIVLTFMFLFPLFPDDLLCFVAGLSTMSIRYFIVMMLIVRTVCVFASSYSINGNIIPYNTWWGILLWVIFACVTILLTILVYKHGNKIEQWIKNKIARK
ncbi:MAG: TVP38/TMEM64 family protein [Clostridia bacterium]|nr:TVP38/TMEM64 family protein [Clostridia bacterium]